MTRDQDFVYGTTGCTVELTVGLIGGRWKSVVLHHLLGKTMRFNELKRALPAVTQRMLTLQLRELEGAGLLHRQVYAEVPPKVEYRLTELGQSLEPLILMMKHWGADYRAQMQNAAPLPDATPAPAK